MRSITHYHFITTPTVGEDGYQVAHRAAGDEQSSFLAKLLRGQGLQPIDRGILLIDVVAHLCRVHRFTHGWRGLRDRIAAQVDDLHCRLLFHPQQDAGHSGTGSR